MSSFIDTIFPETGEDWRTEGGTNEGYTGEERGRGKGGDVSVRIEEVAREGLLKVYSFAGEALELMSKLFSLTPAIRHPYTGWSLS